MHVKSANKPTGEENLQEIHDTSGRSYKGEHLGDQTREIMGLQQVAEMERIRQQQLMDREKWFRKLLFVIVVLLLVKLLELPPISAAGSAMPDALSEIVRVFRKKPT